MAGKYKKNSHIPRTNPDELNKKLNLGMAMYGESQEWQNAEPEEDGGYYYSSTFGDGWEEIVPNSMNSSRPRALAAGYHRKSQSLVIAFRKPTKTDKKTKSQVVTGESPWVVYIDVPIEMWEDLQSAGSTGRWLLDSGIEMHEYFHVDKTKLEEVVSDILKG